MNPPFLRRASCLLAFLAASPAARAAQFNTYIGVREPHISGGTLLMGQELYRNLDSISQTTLPNATLTAPNPSDTVAFSGGNAMMADSSSTAAYFFRNLDTAAGTVTSSLKLTASDLTPQERFGAMALEGGTALIARLDPDKKSSAHLFRNLDTRSGTITPDATLISSDLRDHDGFAAGVSVSGNTALVGAISGGSGNGAAYFFRNLDTLSGTVTENVRLAAAGSFGFGQTLRLSGGTALVGAANTDGTVGSAYIFRNLDTATGTVAPDVTLTAKNRLVGSYFGSSVSFSGNTALVGAEEPLGIGSAYLFRNINTASGTVTENVKIIPSDGKQKDQFGRGDLEGDQFVILSSTIVTGFRRAYSGSVSSLTVMDSGGARSIDGISFISQDDWIIGQTGDFNSVSLTSGDSGTVSAAGRAVYIGQTAGSDSNALTVEGTLTANQIRVGAAGNTGNSLTVTGIVTTASGVTVAAGSSVGGDGKLNGNLTLNAGASLMFQSGVTLTVGGQVKLDPGFSITSLTGLSGATPRGSYLLIDGTSTNFSTLGISNWGAANAATLGPDKFGYFEQAGGLRLVVVPEPSGLPLLTAAAAGALVLRRPGRRTRGKAVVSL